MGFKDEQKALLERALGQVVAVEDLHKYGLHSDRPMTKAEIISWHLVNRGCLGDLNATKELFDRLLGKPAQQIQAEIKTTNYYDFLMTIVKEEKLGPVVEVKPESAKELPDGSDLLGDLA